ncbi:TetR/AcrR family transcriptional regulator [Streptomyces sp. SID13726]|uniref:TetR/AcrR family transcriptional regulator n=1 Tax=Streptomyces sp. SID13726 TaxID=2706058 RepID=UPI0013B6CC4E|nr:TetR/AcrR family transcriptional regulator [Streptomyces sp. SID13726]NEA97711.1 TetR/AcrR family transcriptional regulator [Streptomyces sp. SID13726]
MAIDPRQRRAARHARPGTQPGAEPATPTAPAKRKAPITVERITDAALQVVAAEGYDALTVRSVSNALGTGPSSLYAHIVNKADIDDLLIGRLCSRIVLPEPDPARWREQIRDVCAQLRDQYLAYPGVSRAALAMVPTDLETLRLSEGMLAILLAGDIAPRTAAWAIDALSLYVAGYALEQSLVRRRRQDPDAAWVLSEEELVRRFSALPEETFPQTRRHAAELTSGTGYERFDFALGLLIDSLPVRGGAGGQDGRSAGASRGGRQSDRAADR